MRLLPINTTAERLRFILSFVFRFILLMAIAGAVINSRWNILFISSLILILTFLPAIIERNLKVYLPAEFEITVIVFIYASLFLGNVHGYYTRFWWWDIILHTGSAISLGIIGFLILFVLYEEQKIKAKPVTIAVFSFCFALAIGALWEILEFAMDSFFGMNMQRSGLVDTMWDLIVDSIGALLISVAGYFYLKGRKTRVFMKLIQRFVSENPSYFENKKLSLVNSRSDGKTKMVHDKGTFK
ncbi:MAG: hypothetical protein ABIC04_05080 [Nanoarchaeota archaeon]